MQHRTVAVTQVEWVSSCRIVVWGALLTLTTVSPLDLRVDPEAAAAPAFQSLALAALPSPGEDEVNENANVARLMPSIIDVKSAHACDLGVHAEKEQCLQVKGRACMWTRIESRNPRLRVQESNSYCLPCEIDGAEMPCWNVGAWIGDKQVTECVMSCRHQRRIWQPQYACSDGKRVFISKSLCFDRGKQSGSKCMFVTYKDSEGRDHGSCGPCRLDGSGSWGCPSIGEKGPEDGSKVTSCVSQCELPCVGEPDCPETKTPTFMMTLPPTLPLPQTPGVGTGYSPPHRMLSAPGGFPGEPPQELEPDTTAKPVKQARPGFDPSMLGPPPKKYDPVVIYRTPGDYWATTLAPPPLWPPEYWPAPLIVSSLLQDRPLLLRRGTKATLYDKGGSPRN